MIRPREPFVELPRFRWDKTDSAHIVEAKAIALRPRPASGIEYHDLSLKGAYGQRGDAFLLNTGDDFGYYPRPHER
ncbi:hypothetical protein SAMN04489726_0716 [Allokutzneria albata]|uniref:Uncharacterized protein n=1 Tax=Allokutzneria albata TaxID=211114 RepID=A0A1G9RVJ4_ALLAB|nr:hypothetical protein SAMN04489726_0716 [Allokutzneria albata]